LWIMLIPVFATAQTHIEPRDTLSQQQFIKGCAMYRQNFIDNIVNSLVEFNLLCDSLKSVSEHPEGHDLFRERLMDKLLECEYRDMNNMIDAAMPASIWDKNVRKCYKEWGSKYYIQIFQFSFLLANKIIEPKEPYKLTTLSDFREEIFYYKLNEGQVFVDVGAGIGAVSFILALSGLPIEIYMTELDEQYLSYLNNQVQHPSFLNSMVQIQVDTAGSKSLGLEKHVMADRMLMREVFHHLKYPEEVLQSVRSHLKQDGLLILVESTKDLSRGGKDKCIKAMESGQIVKLISDNGFELCEKKIVGSSYIMRFKVRA
jgi:2-polyprenyl-3-methyl-5-hydroxy-6-metoxy-1,4-benzoquinol methylase